MGLHHCDVTMWQARHTAAKGVASFWNQHHWEILQVINWNQEELRTNNYTLLTANEIAVGDEQLVVNKMIAFFVIHCGGGHTSKSGLGGTAAAPLQTETRDKLEAGQSFTHRRVGLSWHQKISQMWETRSTRSRKERGEQEGHSCRHRLWEHSSSWRGF